MQVTVARKMRNFRVKLEGTMVACPVRERSRRESPAAVGRPDAAGHTQQAGSAGGRIPRSTVGMAEPFRYRTTPGRVGVVQVLQVCERRGRGGGPSRNECPQDRMTVSNQVTHKPGIFPGPEGRPNRKTRRHTPNLTGRQSPRNTICEKVRG